jgi:5-methylcytosine-specific restriction endonuclease McrA
MSIRSKILHDMKRERIINNYSDKHRLIDSSVYKELKCKKKCMYCGKGFAGKHPQIHHKIPLHCGGSNNKDNLMAVHSHCHKILDAEVKNDKTI